MRALLIGLGLIALTLSLERLELLFEADQVFFVLVHHLFSDLAQEVAFLGRNRGFDLHLSELLLQQLFFLGPDLLDVKVRMSTLVVRHQVDIAREKLGTLGALGKLDWCAHRLSKDLLVRLECLLLDLGVCFHIDEQLLLLAYLVFQLETARFLHLLLADGGIKLEFAL